ncbi:DNA-processing protein DprA [Oxalobacter paraformigenes]|uniref:DNA protecting protein DprA n=1 Tax=Oxalobacter paraformigenes TaxID=556268 RepID=C3X5C1_9BURK|nr:DNA-processing protein DprA [Oxalobacter paraformigenes]EEO28407.1 DNA protecting protein DprA [Oxalobacter paraformigenes]
MSKTIPYDKEELAAWIRLVLTPGIGIRTAHKMLTAYGLPQNIFMTSYRELQRIVSPQIADAIYAPVPEAITEQIEKTQKWLEEPGNAILTLSDSNYPGLLLEIPDPPLMLYVKGRVELLSSPSIAIVGSRNATAQGRMDAKEFARSLSESGLTIISGLALGIDAAAHRGGLKGKGSTIAVVGTGADIVYPARNRELALQIAEEGCVISEFPLGTGPLASNFPRRNRVISGLSGGILVVEAAARSGSLITAKTAIDQGRDVFAIPGSIHSPLSRGCHELIRQGAKLVETSQDVLEELKHYNSVSESSDRKMEPENTSLQEDILLQMGFDPVDSDTLCERCEIDAASLNVELLSLELAGEVESLAGGFYRRLVKR